MNRLPITLEELRQEAVRLQNILRDDSYDSDIAGAYWSRDLETTRQRLLEIERTIGYLVTKKNRT
jgi:hypothetical protein